MNPDIEKLVYVLCETQYGNCTCKINDMPPQEICPLEWAEAKAAYNTTIDLLCEREWPYEGDIGDRGVMVKNAKTMLQQMKVEE